MTLQEELERAQQEQQKIVARINSLDRERQELLQEALRIDGDIRTLTRLAKKKE